MKKQISHRLLFLAGLVGATGCVVDAGEQTLDGDVGGATASVPGENVATTEQPLIGSAHAQAFGADFGTPDLGNGFGLFGAALAAGDLDGDGAADMVVGVPEARYGTPAYTGAVDIFWGSKVHGTSFGGLSNSRVTQLHQPGAGNAEAGDRFGDAVAIGDFDCDGHLDLAISAPHDDLSLPDGGHRFDAGNITILYGPDFMSSRWQLFWQGSAGIPGAPEDDDQFGFSLAAGNFNGDTSNGHACDDLAIGTPLESIGYIGYAGAVTVLYGGSTGLNTAAAPAPQLWHQNVGSLFGVVEDDDLFGWSLAAGDFNKDGKDDLAIGVKGENSNEGLVQVILGTSGGLSDAGNSALQLSDFSGLSDQHEAAMGSALARGDFDHDGDDDLAVGAPYLSPGGIQHAGGVLIYRQGASGLAPALRYDQNSTNVPGIAEVGDDCGRSLVAGDFNGDGQDDLASGCPWEVVTTSGHDEGAFNTAYFGFASGSFAVAQAQLWHKNSTGIPAECASDDHFSLALASGDFNGDGRADLAAGTWTLGESTVNVLYGAP